MNRLMKFAAVIAILSGVLFCAGCGKTVAWMNDKGPHDAGEMHDPSRGYVFTFAETNTVEIGIRSDGVVVWRKSK